MAVLGMVLQIIKFLILLSLCASVIVFVVSVMAVLGAQHPDVEPAVGGLMNVGGGAVIVGIIAGLCVLFYGLGEHKHSHRPEEH